MIKNPPANAGDTRDSGSISRLGRFPGEGNGNLLQYSCLENSMDRGAWWARGPWCHKESNATEHTCTCIPSIHSSIHPFIICIQIDVKVLVAQSYLTLCAPMDCGPPGSSVHGIFQARILEWGATSYSRGSSRPRD